MMCESHTSLRASITSYSTFIRYAGRTLHGDLYNKKGSLSNVGVFTLRVFFGTNHSYGWCHSFCSKVEYVL